MLSEHAGLLWLEVESQAPLDASPRSRCIVTLETPNGIVHARLSVA